MNKIITMFNNECLQVAVIAWFIAQLLKVITVLIKYKRVDFRRFVGSGGMPSSHSSFVSAMAISIGELNGYDSTIFAFAVVVALVVMYDASGVRRAAGKQARVLNQMMVAMEENDTVKFDEKLKELIGHTPIEVFAGCILGIVIALIRFA